MQKQGLLRVLAFAYLSNLFLSGPLRPRRADSSAFHFTRSRAKRGNETTAANPPTFREGTTTTPYRSQPVSTFAAVVMALPDFPAAGSSGDGARDG
jgi:hypothetical protein